MLRQSHGHHGSELVFLYDIVTYCSAVIQLNSSTGNAWHAKVLQERHGSRTTSSVRTATAMRLLFLISCCMCCFGCYLMVRNAARTEADRVDAYQDVPSTCHDCYLCSGSELRTSTRYSTYASREERKHRNEAARAVQKKRNVQAKVEAFKAPDVDLSTKRIDCEALDIASTRTSPCFFACLF